MFLFRLTRSRVNGNDFGAGYRPRIGRAPNNETEGTNDLDPGRDGHA